MEIVREWSFFWSGWGWLTGPEGTGNMAWVIFSFFEMGVGGSMISGAGLARRVRCLERVCS